MVFRASVMVGFILVALPALGDKTTPLTKAELSQIFVAGCMYERYGPGSRPELVKQDWYSHFLNGTRLEISELDVVVVSLFGSKEIFRSPVRKLRSFDNERVPHVGSLCALTATGEPCRFSIELPSSAWTTETRLSVRVVGGRAYRKATNLHDSGHLITFFTNETTPKIMAAFKKDPSLFKITTSQGMTPLLIACGAADESVVKFMAANGCSYTAKGKLGQDAMYIAAGGGDTRTLDLLLSKGLKVNTWLPKSTRTPLMQAIALRQIDSMKWLLAHGANPNMIDNRGWPVINYVVQSGSLEMLKILSKSADKHFQDTKGFGWMHYATARKEFLPYLVSIGLSVNDAPKPNKITPLMTAAGQGRLDSALWLVEHGANIYAKDAFGRSVFDFAKSSNTLGTDRFFREKVAKYLKK